MMCPRAARGGEHQMRLDVDGRWYCPIERDAERGEAWKKRQAEIDELDAAFSGPTRLDAGSE